MQATPPHIDPPSRRDQVPQIVVLARDDEFAPLERFFQVKGEIRVGRARTAEEAILRQTVFGELIVVVGDPDPAIAAEPRPSLIISREVIDRLVDGPD